MGARGGCRGVGLRHDRWGRLPGCLHDLSTEEWHTSGLLRNNAAVENFNVLGSLGVSRVLAAFGLWLG
ncbi:hypothetical protein ACGFIK_11175 [Micromonospora sp. NPDC048871]|uniref:hypothetical protein n=1 Tax=unclassified Micromonospora TaxID=2617518 RepID=UPI002E0F2AFE|nr:hypothetical protein OIE53_23215 [Micromonospora sp. NBC_01739]